MRSVILALATLSIQTLANTGQEAWPDHAVVHNAEGQVIRPIIDWRGPHVQILIDVSQLDQVQDSAFVQIEKKSTSIQDSGLFQDLTLFTDAANQVPPVSVGSTSTTAIVSLSPFGYLVRYRLLDWSKNDDKWVQQPFIISSGTAKVAIPIANQSYLEYQIFKWEKEVLDAYTARVSGDVDAFDAKIKVAKAEVASTEQKRKVELETIQLYEKQIANISVPLQGNISELERLEQMKADYARTKPEYEQLIKDKKKVLANLEAVRYPVKYLKHTVLPVGPGVELLIHDDKDVFEPNLQRVEIDSRESSFVLLENANYTTVELTTNIASIAPALELDPIVPELLWENLSLSDPTPAAFPRQKTPKLSYVLKRIGNEQGPIQLTYDLKAKVKDKDKEKDKVIAEGKVIVYQRHRIRFRAGAMYSDLKRFSKNDGVASTLTRSRVVDGVSETYQIILPGNQSVSGDYELSTMIGTTIFWKPRTLTWDEPELEMWERFVPNLFVGVATEDPLENLLAGVSIEPKAGFSLQLGVHWGEVTHYSSREVEVMDPFSGEPVWSYTKQDGDTSWDSAIYGGISLDLGAFAKLIKPLFGK